MPHDPFEHHTAILSSPARPAKTNLGCARGSIRLLLGLGVCLGWGSPGLAVEPRPLPRFERIVIDEQFPGAYQVEVADVNGDGKPDIVALGGGTCAWYENPTWHKRIVTNPKQTPGIISTATADLDGDGKAEIAIAYEFSMNQPTKGKLLLAHPGQSLDDPWTLVPVAEVGSIHRLRWMENEASNPLRKQEAPQPPVHPKVNPTLVVAPIFGPSAKPPLFQEEPAHLTLFEIQRPEDDAAVGIGGGRGGFGGGGDLKAGSSVGGGGKIDAKPNREIAPSRTATNQAPINRHDQKPRLAPGGKIIGHSPVTHAIDITNLDGDPKSSGLKLPLILSASNLGVTSYSAPAMTSGILIRTHEILVPGSPGEAPKRGASEVHTGRYRDGSRFLATVEPWHGTDVVIYKGTIKDPLRIPRFGPRTVIDTTLKDGHALWVADVDGDGDDEVFAGYRGQGTSLIGYDFDGKTWNRTVIDTAIAAQDLRGGDLDSDGTPDLVAVGGSTHNVVWYRPLKN